VSTKTNNNAPMFCKLENQFHGGWFTTITVGGVTISTFSTGETALEAVEAAQDRAADFVRGLQEMHNSVKNGKTVSIP
jgi:hypothetical protein